MDVLKAIYRREFELYEEIFAIRYREDGNPYTEVPPTGSMVVEVLKRLKDIWINVLPLVDGLKMESEGRLSCLLLAGGNPHRALPAISKTALFAERIFIPHPMLFMFELRGCDGPYFRPQDWAPQFMRTALFIISLRNWIADDFLRLIPCPCQWNENIKSRVKQTLSWTVEKAMESYGAHMSELNSTDSFAEYLADIEPDLRNFMLKKLEREDPNHHKELLLALDKQPEYPDWLKIPISKESKGEIIHQGVFMHPLEVRYLLNNWNFYVTPIAKIEKVRLINNMNNNNVINDFLLNLPVELPSDVSLEQMYQLRKSGLLNNFRGYLLTEYEKIRNSTNEEDLLKFQEMFSATLNSKLDELSQELELAKTGILKDVLDVGIRNIGTSYTFAQGSLSIATVLNVAGSIMAKAIPRIHRNRRAHKNPLIVLHKLNK